MEVLGAKYNNLTRIEALSEIRALFEKKTKANIFFLNADCLYNAQYDSEYRNIVNSSDLVLPDGIGLSFISRIFGQRMKENCNGTDLSPGILEIISEKDYSVIFLGGVEGVASKAADQAKKNSIDKNCWVLFRIF